MNTKSDNNFYEARPTNMRGNNFTQALRYRDNDNAYCILKILTHLRVHRLILVFFFLLLQHVPYKVPLPPPIPEDDRTRLKCRLCSRGGGAPLSYTEGEILHSGNYQKG